MDKKKIIIGIVLALLLLLGCVGLSTKVILPRRNKTSENVQVKDPGEINKIEGATEASSDEKNKSSGDTDSEKTISDDTKSAESGNKNDSANSAKNIAESNNPTNTSKKTGSKNTTNTAKNTDSNSATNTAKNTDSNSATNTAKNTDSNSKANTAKNTDSNNKANTTKQTDANITTNTEKKSETNKQDNSSVKEEPTTQDKTPEKEEPTTQEKSTEEPTTQEDNSAQEEPTTEVSNVKPEKPAVIEVSSVTIDKTTAELYVGETLELKCTVSPADATDKKVTWTTTDSTVATVNNNGVVTAKKIGVAGISAKTSNGKSDICAVKVVAKEESTTEQNNEEQNNNNEQQNNEEPNNNNEQQNNEEPNNNNEQQNNEEPDESEVVEASIDKMFEVPYISTYYFNPKPSINDNIEIPLYLTDYEQSEYLKNNTTKTLDLVYEVDGVKKTVKDILLGDYTLKIGKLSEGIHTFSVQAYDRSKGLYSHKLYNELWVVNPSTYEISAEETYTITSEDLAKYSIHNDDSKDASDLISTRDGLTQMFADLQSSGYRKVILPTGTYRINGEKARQSCIKIPSYLTVDMNGSTFKLDTIISDNEGCIVTMDNAIDAHLINGTLEGDRFERKELGLEKEFKGEPINTILFYYGKYCSINDLVIKNTTGHSVGTGCTWDAPSQAPSEYTRTVIVNGEEVPNENCSTSCMMDLTKIINYEEDNDYMYVGHHHGYRGIKGDSGVIYVSFYDSDKNFMETVTGYQYRKMLIPEGAKYARVTLLGNNFSGDNFDTNILVYAMRMPEYLEISDIDFYDTRTTALAPTACNNMLIENVTYTRCGNSITPCPVDFEDGWEECQDVYYRNNEVIENAERTTATIVDNSGLNHVYENCKNHKLFIRARLVGGIVHDWNDSGSTINWFLGDKKSNGFGRVYDNNCGYISFMDNRNEKPDGVAFKVKNSTINNGSNTTTYTASIMDSVVYENCTFPNFSGENATFVGCTIQPSDSIRNKLHFYDCTFKVLDGTSSEVFLNFNNIDSPDRIFDNCTFEGKSRFGTFIKAGDFKDCTFEDVSLYLGIGTEDEKFVFENCDINSSSDSFIQTGPFAYSRGHLDVLFKNCNITHTGDTLIYLYSKPDDNAQIVFDNCEVNKSNGYLLSGYNMKGSLNDIKLDILFKNTEIDRNLKVDEINTYLVNIEYEE